MDNEIFIDKLNYIERLKDKLYATDYIALKNSEGIDCSKYGDWKATRQSFRDEIQLVEPMTEDEFQEYIKDKESDT